MIPDLAVDAQKRQISAQQWHDETHNASYVLTGTWKKKTKKAV